MFGNIGPGEMIFILVVLLLVFGAKRLPELGGSLGKGIREFKRSMNDIQSEINRTDEPPSQQQTLRPAAQAPAVPPASEAAQPVQPQPQPVAQEKSPGA